MTLDGIELNRIGLDWIAFDSNPVHLMLFCLGWVEFPFAGFLRVESPTFYSSRAVFRLVTARTCLAVLPSPFADLYIAAFPGSRAADLYRLSILSPCMWGRGSLPYFLREGVRGNDPTDIPRPIARHLSHDPIGSRFSCGGSCVAEISGWGAACVLKRHGQSSSPS